jgi:predicted MFS family arabinose efflux permease
VVAAAPGVTRSPSAAAAAHVVRAPMRAIVALSFAACGSSAALRVCDPLLPRLSADFGVGLATASSTVTAFALAYGILQLAYGPLGDRHGKYHVITLACVASALTSLACAAASSLQLLVFARFLAGAAAGGLIPLSLAWIGDVVAYAGRQPVLARFLLGQMLGLALGQLLGGLGADHFGPRPVFLVLTAWFVAAALLLQHSAPPQPAPAADAPPAVSSLPGRLAAVVRVPWARVVLATVFLEGLLFYGALAFIPTHLARRFGVPLTVAGSMLMLFAAGGVIFAVAAPLLLRRLGEAGLVTGGGVLLLASLAAIALARLIGVAALGCFGAGLGFYMLHNTLQVNATQMAPSQRGSSVSLFAACLFVGQSTGVALGGHAAERFGIAPVLLVAALGILLLALGFAALRRRRLTTE